MTTADTETTIAEPEAIGEAMPAEGTFTYSDSTTTVTLRKLRCSVGTDQGLHLLAVYQVTTQEEAPRTFEAHIPLPDIVATDLGAEGCFDMVCQASKGDAQTAGVLPPGPRGGHVAVRKPGSPS